MIGFLGIAVQMLMSIVLTICDFIMDTPDLASLTKLKELAKAASRTS